MFKRTRSHKYLFVLVAFLLMLNTGCGRLNSPHSRLARSVYSPKGTPEAGQQYIIDRRDELEIVVWRCPDLDTTTIVRPQDGGISMPLIGDVEAAGSTPRELAEKISNKLAYYVKEPRVAVGVKAFGQKKVYVLGEVTREGTLYLDREDRIIDLIAQVGGFTVSAAPSMSYIIRGDYDNSRMVWVNLARLLHQGDVTQNVYLKEGDIVYVPRSEIANWNQGVNDIIPTLYLSERMATLQNNIMQNRFDWHEVWNKMADKDYPRRRDTNIVN